MIKKKESNSTIKWYIPLIVFFGVAFVYFLFWALTDKYIVDVNERGVFGDKFGAVNALFSGFAFAGLIITLILQRNELSLQREELEQTRSEFVEQNKTLKRQRFENTFFNLMTLQQHIVENMEYESTDSADYFLVKGREVFKKFYKEQNNFNDSYGLKGALREASVTNIADFFNGYRGIRTLNHYFHSFDGILSYIDSSDLIETSERLQYAIMLRNTLSDDERYILFYYYASRSGYYKTLAEEYTLFCDVVKEYLANPMHKEFFGESAYIHP